MQALPMGTPWGCRGEAVLGGSRILVACFYSYWKLLLCSSSPKCSMVTDAQACSASAGRSLVRGSQNISTGSPGFSSCCAKAKARFPDHLIQSAVRRPDRCGFSPTAERTVCLLHLHVSLVLRRRRVWAKTSKPELLKAPA